MQDPELIAVAVLLPKFRTYWTTDEILKAGKCTHQFKCKSVALYNSSAINYAFMKLRTYIYKKRERSIDLITFFVEIVRAVTLFC